MATWMYVQHLVMLTTKKTPKLLIACPLWGEMTNGFPSQRGSNVESISMSWHHHVFMILHISVEVDIYIYILMLSCCFNCVKQAIIYIFYIYIFIYCMYCIYVGRWAYRTKWKKLSSSIQVTIYEVVYYNHWNVSVICTPPALCVVWNIVDKPVQHLYYLNLNTIFPCIRLSRDHCVFIMGFLYCIFSHYFLQVGLLLQHVTLFKSGD